MCLSFLIKKKLVLEKLVLEFDQPQWQKPYAEFNKPKIIEADKHGYKDGKAL